MLAVPDASSTGAAEPAFSTAPREKPGDTRPYWRGYCQAGVWRGFSSATAGRFEHRAMTRRPSSRGEPMAVAAGGGSLNSASTACARPTQNCR